MNPNARGGAGEVGLFQVIPSDMAYKYSWAASRPSAADMATPEAQIEAGLDVFEGALKASGGNVQDALAIYNSGRPLAQAPEITTGKYVPGVLSIYQSLQGTPQQAAAQPLPQTPLSQPQIQEATGFTPPSAQVAATTPVSTGPTLAGYGARGRKGEYIDPAELQAPPSPGPKTFTSTGAPNLADYLGINKQQAAVASTAQPELKAAPPTVEQVQAAVPDAELRAATGMPTTDLAKAAAVKAQNDPELLTGGAGALRGGLLGAGAAGLAGAAVLKGTKAGVAGGFIGSLAALLIPEQAEPVLGAIEKIFRFGGDIGRQILMTPLLLQKSDEELTEQAKLADDPMNLLEMIGYRIGQYGGTQFMPEGGITRALDDEVADLKRLVETTPDEASAAWEATRAGYTPGKAETAYLRIMEGDNPDVVVQELYDPTLLETVGEMVFDPTNILGDYLVDVSRAATKARILSRFTTPDPRTVTQLAADLKQPITAIQRWNPLRHTSEALQSRLVEDSATVINRVLADASDDVQRTQRLRDFVKWGAEEGGAEKFARVYQQPIATTEVGKKAAILLNSLGGVDGVDSVIRKAAEVAKEQGLEGNRFFDQVAETMYTRMARAVDDVIPVQRTVYEQFSEPIAKAVTHPLNRLFSYLYLNRPGYVVRNAANNFMTALVDGVMPFDSPAHMAQFQGRFGRLASAAEKGLTFVGEPRSGAWYNWFISKSQDVEKAFSHRIVYRATSDFMSSMWPRRVRELVDEIAPALSPEQARTLRYRMSGSLNEQELMEAMRSVLSGAGYVGRSLDPALITRIDKVSPGVGRRVREALEQAPTHEEFARRLADEVSPQVEALRVRPDAPDAPMPEGSPQAEMLREARAAGASEDYLKTLENTPGFLSLRQAYTKAAQSVTDATVRTSAARPELTLEAQRLQLRFEALRTQAQKMHFSPRSAEEYIPYEETVARIERLAAEYRQRIFDLGGLDPENLPPVRPPDIGPSQARIRQEEATQLREFETAARTQFAEAAQRAGFTANPDGSVNLGNEVHMANVLKQADIPIEGKTLRFGDLTPDQRIQAIRVLDEYAAVKAATPTMDDASRQAAFRRQWEEMKAELGDEVVPPGAVLEAPAATQAARAEEVVAQMPRAISGTEVLARVQASPQHAARSDINWDRYADSWGIRPEQQYVLVDVSVDDLARRQLRMAPTDEATVAAKQAPYDPVLITEFEPGRLAVVDGTHSYVAQRQAGATTIRAYVPEKSVSSLGARPVGEQMAAKVQPAPAATDVLDAAAKREAGVAPRRLTPEAEEMADEFAGAAQAESAIPQAATTFEMTPATPQEIAQVEKWPTSIPLAEVNVDPARFQYRRSGKITASGASSERRIEAPVWDDNAAWGIALWRDPANGKVYVVNGHHRVEFAKRLGENGPKELIGVKWFDAPTDKAAMAAGALDNIKQGSTDLIDAATFLREMHYTVAMLRAEGVTITKGVGEKALALAQLPNGVWSQVVEGRIPEDIGVAIGKAFAGDEARMLDAAEYALEEAGKGKLTASRMQEYIGLGGRAPKQTTITMTLFGAEASTKALTSKLVDVNEYITKRFADIRRLGKTASKGKGILESFGESRIDAEAGLAAAKEASDELAKWDVLKGNVTAGGNLAKAGDRIHEIVDDAARQLAGGANEQQVLERAFNDVRAALPDSLGGGEAGRIAGLSQDALLGLDPSAAPGGNPPGSQTLFATGARPGAVGVGADIPPVSPRTMAEFRSQLAASGWGGNQQELDAAIAVLEGRAAYHGINPDSYIRKYSAGVTTGLGPGTSVSELGGQPIAALDLLEDGKALIRVIDKPGIGGIIHELGHWLELDLTPADAAIVGKTFGVDPSVPISEWTVEQQESLANWFVDSMRSGVAPRPGLQGLFDKMADWLREVWTAIKRLGKPMSMDMEAQRVFDKLTTGIPATEAERLRLYDLPNVRGRVPENGEGPKAVQAYFARRARAGDKSLTAQAPLSYDPAMQGAKGRLTPEQINERLNAPRPDAMASEATVADEIDDLIAKVIVDAKKSWDRQPSPGVNMPELDAWINKAVTDLNAVKGAATFAGTEARNFALLDYTGDRRAIDTMANLFLIYPFWASRSFPNWMTRAASRPNMVAGFLRYQNYVRNKVEEGGAPAWLQEYMQFNVPGLPGMLNVNIRYLLDPLYDLATDYDDPVVAASALGRARQHLSNSIGLTMHPTFTIVDAAIRAATGKGEEVSRVLGHLSSHTKLIRYLTGKIGLNQGAGYTLEPWLWRGSSFVGGDDYAVMRATRQLAAMEKNGEITPTEAHDAAYDFASGRFDSPLFKEAMSREIDDRLFPTLASFFMALPARFRYPDEVEIDEAMAARAAIYAQKDVLDDKQYGALWDQFYNNYPFMSVISMSRQDREAADTAWVFDVMSRIPPGARTSAFMEAGVSREILDSFWNADTGSGVPRLEQLDEPDRMRVLAAAMDLAKRYDVPMPTMSAEWDRVSALNTEMYETIEKIFPGVLDQESNYYAIEAQNPAQAQQYLDSNPQINEMRTYRTNYRYGNHLLMWYYGPAARDQAKNYIWSVYMALDKESGARTRLSNTMGQEFKDLFLSKKYDQISDAQLFAWSAFLDGFTYYTRKDMPSEWQGTAPSAEEMMVSLQSQ